MHPDDARDIVRAFYHNEPAALGPLLRLITTKPGLLDGLQEAEVVPTLQAELQAGTSAASGPAPRVLSRLVVPRTVATAAVIADDNFYVESPVVDSLFTEVFNGQVVLYMAPRQSGKSTDVLAVCRRLRKHGVQVVYVDVGPSIRKATRVSALDADFIWEAVLDKLNISQAPGQTCWDTFYRFLQKRDGPRVALVFDDCDSVRDRPAILTDWLIGVRALSQESLQESRLAGQMLVGTARMREAICNAMDGNTWAKLVVACKEPTPFTPSDIGRLIMQIVAERGGELREPIEDWAYSLWSYTEGAKGLTGVCLQLLDATYFHKEHIYKFSTWEQHLHLHSQPTLVTSLPVCLPTAYGRMMSAMATSATAEMRVIIDDLLLTGRHEVSDINQLSSEAHNLWCNGVVRKMDSFLEVSSPLLAAAMVSAALSFMADWPQLPAPPAEPSHRELGEYLLVHAIAQFCSSRLLQHKVSTADGQQVRAYSLQHELSQGLHLVLGSAVLLRALRLKLAVEVRNTMYKGSSTIVSSNKSSSQEGSRADGNSADQAVTASSSGSSANFQGSSARYAGTTEDGVRRRLDIYVGNGPYSTGYQVSSVVSTAALADHAQRCAEYRDLHECQIFAVNFQRPNRPNGRPRKTIAAAKEAESQEDLHLLMRGFAAWPEEQPEQVVFVNVLLELEHGRALLQYMDQPDLVEVIQLKQSQSSFRVTRPVQACSQQPTAVANGRSARKASLLRQQRNWQPLRGWPARAWRTHASLYHAVALCAA